MYAVTGITGKVGAAVARSLLAAGQPVRAVIRDQSKSAAWAKLGCDIALADVGDTGALTTAFEGTAGVFGVRLNLSIAATRLSADLSCSQFCLDICPSWCSS